MSVDLRDGMPEDAAACGKICHDAFEAIANEHKFPKDFPSPEVAADVTGMMISHPGFYAVVAERDGTIVGSNFLDERSQICGVGPITVDPAEQDSGVGGELMRNVLQRAEDRRAPGVRLLQDAFHNRSFALYTKLGFQARATTAVLTGPAVRAEIPGLSVRPAAAADVDACNRLCTRIHGQGRAGEVTDAIGQGVALVVERGDRITGYTSGVGFFGHSVGESNDDLRALIGATPEYAGPGFHVPTDNDDLLRWCFDSGLRMVKAMTLMTLGLYNEPQGAYLPSVLY
ncbi:MAG: GNAT family N-acetyltransferase [Planctomycetes bacterium]|nr:GNAT family N-acetyltransferase [Planctomycetota bacterium]